MIRFILNVLIVLLLTDAAYNAVWVYSSLLTRAPFWVSLHGMFAALLLCMVCMLLLSAAQAHVSRRAARTVLLHRALSR